MQCNHFVCQGGDVIRDLLWQNQLSVQDEILKSTYMSMANRKPCYGYITFQSLLVVYSDDLWHGVPWLWLWQQDPLHFLLPHLQMTFLPLMSSHFPFLVLNPEGLMGKFSKSIYLYSCCCYGMLPYILCFFSHFCCHISDQHHSVSHLSHSYAHNWCIYNTLSSLYLPVLPQA